jgi:hypothetical protein
MTPVTLQALRRHLFFSVSEAAELIGGVTERSWQFWESGRRTIPADVINKIDDLCEWRNSAIRAATQQILDADLPDGMDLVVVWYTTLDDWMSLTGRDPVLWRPQCSVIAEICSRLAAIAVPFDSTNYFAWLGKKTDSESMRSQWAASQTIRACA